MNPLALVLAGHLLGDWIVQTDRQAAGKVWPQMSPMMSELVAAFEEAGQPRQIQDPATGDWVFLEGGTLDLGIMVPRRDARRWWLRTWRWNQAHVASYHAVLALLVGPWWHDWWAVSALVVSWASHSLIDRRWPVRWLMRHTGSGPFAETAWGVLAVDQALHLSILALLVAARG